MKDLNTLQKGFLEALSAIQEKCVQTALCTNGDGTLEEVLYDTTSDVIINIMEVLDGYASSNIGKLEVTCQKTGERLKENPYIELHDIVCDYLKCTK